MCAVCTTQVQFTIISLMDNSYFSWGSSYTFVIYSLRSVSKINVGSLRTECSSVGARIFMDSFQDLISIVFFWLFVNLENLPSRCVCVCEHLCLYFVIPKIVGSFGFFARFIFCWIIPYFERFSCPATFLLASCSPVAMHSQVPEPHESHLTNKLKW
jgi:hypothetical protein